MQLTKLVLNILFYVFMLICFTASASPASEIHPAADVVKGNNTFALQLYHKLCATDGNLFFSPYSISSALAMTYAGASGETADQMAATLHFPAEQEALHSAFANLASHFHGMQENGKIALHIANALWIQQSVKVLESFLDIVKTQYQAGIFHVNFQTAYEEVRAEINAWVEKQTHQKIKELLPLGSLNALTRLVLTNAIYFKGNWDTPFDPKQTQEETFWLSPEKEILTPMMHRSAMVKYAENDALQLLHLPYTGEEISMIVLLPGAKDGLTDLEAQLTLENLTQWITQSSVREVEVFLPKFTLTSQFRLADTLKTMGMSAAFSENADFSKIEASKSLSISDVIHKAFVEVNEEGTEAAAATAVIVGLTSIAEPQPIPVFKADHPFIFLIRDSQTGSLLFCGRIMNPDL